VSYDHRLYYGGQKSGQILTKRQQEILKALTDKPTISREELVESLEINPSAIQKHVATLMKKGFIKRIGPDKGGYWEVLK